MLFISKEFFTFISIFFILYWAVFNRKSIYQNALLLLGSYFFYSVTNFKLLSILIILSFLVYTIGINIEKNINNDKIRKRLLYLGLFMGIGTLLFFKYFNFFIHSFNDVFKFINLNLGITYLKILVPIGISFFSFKAISYLVDISSGKIAACKSPLNFFTYLAFFPTILSGPIDKPQTFLPQLEQPRSFTYQNGIKGLKQILWGIFKKMVIADNLAIITTGIFTNDGGEPIAVISLIFGSFLYTIQLYTDFSGYTDMAIGVGRLLGFKIQKNFNFPLFSTNIAEFWRNWHISLTSWVSEYVFTPLNFKLRDIGRYGTLIAIFINLIIIGIWHGPNWTFVLFGIIHGIFFIPLVVSGKLNKRRKKKQVKYAPKEVLGIIWTFTILSLSLIIFRAKDIKEVGYFFSSFINIDSLFSAPKQSLGNVSIYIIIIIFFIVEWRNKKHDFTLEKFGQNWHIVLRYALFSIVILAILFYGAKEQKFIYFNF